MNQHLVNNLEILERYYAYEWKKHRHSKDNFRKLAYSKAINTIVNLNFKITSIDQVKKLRGIGKSILEKINEFLKTGVIKKVKEINDTLDEFNFVKQNIIKAFLNIWGVGDTKANILYDKGYRSIDSLRKDPSILNRQQLIGLKYYDDLQLKIPRIDITVIQTVIRYILNKEFGKKTYTLMVAGSYRRYKETSNDIDIMLTSRIFNLENTVHILQKWGVISDVLSMQKEKFMGIGKCPNTNENHFRLDIEFLPKEEFVYGLLYFTGSKDFNKEIRYHAKKLGYTLNQHGLKNNKTGKYIHVDTEEDIFKILNVNYIEPNLR